MTAVPQETLDQVRARLAVDGADPTPDRVAAALRSEGRVVGDATVLAVVDTLRRDVFGAGPLDPLLADDGVTDVVVNGPTDVYVDRGCGLEPSAVRFPDDASVRRLAQRLAASAGRRLDDAVPFVDVRLRDGTRFHAVLAPVAHPGTCLSLRVPARRAFTLAELVEMRAMPREGADLLAALVEARLAFLVSGGTGTGKTTLLASLLSTVPADQRLVVVEDSAELRPRHPHVVCLEARLANVEGAGEITLRDLVRQALRMRPDRLVVGETRGAEVVDMLAAMNTGHEGGCGTVHANSAADVPARLEALAVAAGLSRDAAAAQMAAAVEVVLHLGRGRDGRRRLQQVAVLERRGDIVRAVDAVLFDAEGRVSTGEGARRLERLLHAEPR
ncbi:MAG: TadA family conjugal transfer-associated ATPase [Propionibacteriales bacterium]|nr:TadA family conjugal transfer-associated ATPase [Propionibacteriales bacterium]